MSYAKTVIELLQRGGADAVAVEALGRQPLKYGMLRRHVDATVLALNNLGVGRNDPVAIVLPNGPEMAMAFVAISAGATTAPLNPGYRADEFEFYLSDLKAKLLVVAAGHETVAGEVARKLGIPVAELRWSPNDPAGFFEIAGTSTAVTSNRGGQAETDDIALVLHTSGTTSRPKLVPLSHQNVCASAANIAKSLSLVSNDRCLNVMPLFHIHGLIAAVLSSFHVGSSVLCTPGFDALKFFGWMQETAPTWYTAVPTMHQVILGRAGRNREALDEVKLRFVRSSSASLPPQVMSELEKTFQAPVIEAYGMTEAAHQMASNPLPPRARKPGSVGMAAGPEIAVMNESGHLLPMGSVGEVVIRGANVTAGYLGNVDANETAFVDGWFRTGDQGVIDEEGYLRLTGRLKEIINRGGEKISPREVDEVLLDHPAVLQAVTFAIPHKKLGEEIGAALVLETGLSVSKSELKEFVSHRLADFKVPRQVVFLNEIPKGPTGKVQRIGLAQKLGLA